MIEPELNPQSEYKCTIFMRIKTGARFVFSVTELKRADSNVFPELLQFS